MSNIFQQISDSGKHSRSEYETDGLITPSHEDKRIKYVNLISSEVYSGNYDMARKLISLLEEGTNG